MKRILFALAILWSLVGAPFPAIAQSPELEAAYWQYEALNAQGKFAEAEAFARKAVELSEAEFGAHHPSYAVMVYNLAELYRSQGRTGEAEPLHIRALAIREKSLGPEHPNVAQSLNGLALLYHDQGRYAEAEPLQKRAVAINEKALGPDHPSVATGLNNLAELYRYQGRHSEAEPLYKRALVIDEKALGPEHLHIAVSLNNLALLYDSQGRTSEAEPLLKRALAIWEKALGPEHPDVGQSLNNLAELYRAQGRTSEAEPLYKRSRAILEKALGPNHPHVARSLTNLALLYDFQGRTSEAEPLLKRALAIWEKALGPEHPDFAASLNTLAALYERQGGYGEAGPLYKRALSIYEKALGAEHPDIATGLNNLAGTYWAQGHHGMALEHLRRASAIHRSRAARTGGGRGTGGLSEQRRFRYVFLRHLQATLKNPTGEAAARGALTGEGFEAGQLANATGTAAALSRMAARFAAGDDALAALVRERQDAVQRWQSLDGALVKAVSRPPGERDKAGEAALRQALSGLDKSIGRIDTHLAMAFPQFSELSAPQPVTLVETQALLAEDEALLTYLVWDEESVVFAVRRDRVVARKIKLGEKELRETVMALRRGLDPTGVLNLADLPSFDTSAAFRLYRKLLQPVDYMLDGARHVFVVPDGALQSLPLGVLVTKESQGEVTDFAGYRHTQWLARTYAMTTLPSVSSLRALRRFAKQAKAPKPFLGIGDPQLKGKTGSSRGMRSASLLMPRGVADVDAVRRLASLPDTANELRFLARTLGAGEEALMLGAEATETRVKQAALADYRVLAFATHGLMAGDLTDLSEPALVLTPPTEGSDQDDGLLTASEVAHLKLDADWVILSACNTAASDGTPGAEGLSGLAKAFFYAGSRALLVSHWPVASKAAVGIITRMLVEAEKPGVGRAEAHRRAILALIDDKDRPHFAHPLFWAPFVVVGEGGLAGRTKSP